MIEKYPWWKSKKCKVCKAKLRKDIEYPLIRLKSSDGMEEIEVCNNCANFFEGSADVLNKGKERFKPEED
jgi:hypothetical protein